MVATEDYYVKVVSATEDFLGPAAERFVNRQIEFHIKKDPHDLNKDDVKILRDSLKIGLGVLVKDPKIVSEAVKKFDIIAKK